MTDAFKVEFSLIGKDEFLARPANIQQAVRDRLLQTMKLEMLRVADYVRAEKLQGQVLNHRTGALSRAITGSATLEGNTVVGIVGVKGIPYAGVHEFGGTYEIPAHQRVISQAFGRPIVPRTVTVKTHNATFPERSYLRTGANENVAQVESKLRAVATEVLHAS